MSVAPDQNLYVVTVVSNPRRFRSRYDLYRKFEKYVACSGARLFTVEMAFGDRPHELTSCDNPMHLQLRSEHELWHKENMVNLGIQRLPKSWQYVAWVDADITFARPDWVQETVEKLQHHHVVQMFSVAQDLDPNFVPFNRRPGFIYHYLETGNYLGQKGKGLYPSNSHPGYAWAANRQAIDTLGGLIDWAILGAGDHHMATSLIGKAHHSVPDGLKGGNYEKMIMMWGERAKRLGMDVGYVDGLVNHQWHGKKRDRRYHDRWQVLIRNNYDPAFDIMRDWQGLWQLEGSKPMLRDGIRNYFQARNEDSVDND